MGLRPTKTNEGASDRCRGINNLDPAFNKAVPALKALTILSLTLLSLHAQQSQKRLVRRICGLVLALVWPENPIRRIPSSTKGCISVRNFGT